LCKPRKIPSQALLEVLQVTPKNLPELRDFTKRKCKEGEV